MIKQSLDYYRKIYTVCWLNPLLNWSMVTCWSHHWPWGRLAAIPAFNSPSLMILCSLVSTSNIFPGISLPFWITFSAGAS